MRRVGLVRLGAHLFVSASLFLDLRERWQSPEALSPRPPSLADVTSTATKQPATISRHNWVHGLVLCPTCGLPLDEHRDHGDVEGTHQRCGVAFRLNFDDVTTQSPEIRRAAPRGR